jgi:micrococcal nuclease
MKKSYLLLTLTTFLVAACNPTSVSSSESMIPLPNLVISKLYTASSTRNNVIELYNPTDASISLTGLSLDFYNNGSNVITNQILLNGQIEALGYYVVGGSAHDSVDVKNKMDFQLETGSLPFNGDDAIRLTKSNQVIDAIGVIGFDISYSANQTLIRLGEKEDYQASPIYNRFQFISYLPNLFQYLKNDLHEIKNHDQLYDGPRLELRYANYPFVQSGSTTIGGGGYVETTNVSIADGDTATFAPSGAFSGSSVRYYYINTPEVDGNYVRAEAWGYVASKYNKEFVMRNPDQSVFYIQSIMGGALKEVNNRALGLVWVNQQLSQFLIVREGLSESVASEFTQIDLNLSYKNVPYLFFLQYAEHIATINGWGTKGFPSNPDGEKSPDWNYLANGGVGALATQTPIWSPKIPLPW